MQLLADEIGVPIVILGPDLQIEGITKNQSFGLDERDQPAEEVLLKILRQANPDGKLVYVIKDVPGKGEQIWLTTRVAAAMRGDTLPETLKRGAPPNRAVWAGGGQVRQWSDLISRESLEAEIKDQVSALALVTKRHVDFAKRSPVTARSRLTLLSILFQIVDNYGQEIAWRGQTIGLRDACAKCAADFKDPQVANPAALEELHKLNIRLERLVTKGIGEPAPGASNPAWHTYVARPALMIWQEGIRSQFGQWLADARQFPEHARDALRQAEILAVISIVIQDPGFESADDLQYDGHARSYQFACLQLIKTLRPEPPQRIEFDPVQAAYQRLTKACDACHADFR